MTDETLALRARDGDELAFRHLLRRLEGQVRWAIHDCFLPGADPDDLRQEAMIGLTEAIRDFSPGRISFRTFSGHVMRRRVIDAVAAANRVKRHPTEPVLGLDGPALPGEDDTLMDRVPSRERTPEEMVEARESFESFIRLVVTECSDLQRQVMSDVMSGAGYRDIATARHVSVKTVDNALAKGRRKVRAAIDAEARAA